MNLMDDLEETENLMIRLAPEKRDGINTPLYIIAAVLRDVLIYLIKEARRR